MRYIWWLIRHVCHFFFQLFSLPIEKKKKSALKVLNLTNSHFFLFLSPLPDSFSFSSSLSSNDHIQLLHLQPLKFVAPVLDVVYVSEEKEKVVPLVSNIIGYVTPYLKNHRYCLN